MTDLSQTDVEVPVYNPIQLLELQAVFGRLVQSSPELTRFLNQFGPVVLATGLFTFCEDYREDPADPTQLIQGNSALEAEAKAIGILRGVASAFAAFEDEVAVEPSESEIDEDTEITPV